MMDEATATPAIKARVAKNLTSLREAAGLDPATLDDRAELDEGRVVELERGDGLPDHNEMWKIAGALGVGVGEFFDGIRWTPPVDGGDGYEIDA
jgi:transcriptional regulator with XRE-family HTH domain